MVSLKGEGDLDRAPGAMITLHGEDPVQDLDDLPREIDRLRVRLDALRPLENPSILHALDLEYTYESNRIEGNTLTLRETALVIDRGLTVGGKSMREHLEAINHHEATLFLADLVRERRPLTEALVKQLQGLILRGIDRDNAGVYRSVPVMIAGSRHVPPQPWAVPVQMEQCLAWYAAEGQRLHPVVLAAEVHERIATIHPFIDGNGRTARLAMNLILLAAGYPIAIIPGDTDSRRAYYDALERANLKADTADFHRLIAGHVLAMAIRLMQIAGEQP
jgi:Fic family protein